jgi:hypothetical protein
MMLHLYVSRLYSVACVACVASCFSIRHTRSQYHRCRLDEAIIETWEAVTEHRRSVYEHTEDVYHMAIVTDVESCAEKVDRWSARSMRSLLILLNL